MQNKINNEALINDYTRIQVQKANFLITELHFISTLRCTDTGARKG